MGLIDASHVSHYTANFKSIDIAVCLLHFDFAASNMEMTVSSR